MTTLLCASALYKTYGERRVLVDAALELHADETVVLLGTNGAGKSTLLRCLLGLERPDLGEVRVLGATPRRALDRVGYVPDQPDVDGWMTPRELYRFLAPHYATWDVQRATRFAEALAVPMATRFERLSRGEAAKAMLVAALAPAPPLVVLDEAFARLAPPVREEVLEFFVREAPTEGGAALVATHDLDVAARLADRVLLLDGGRLHEFHELHGEGGGPLPARLRSLYDGRATEALAG
ncbi:MAG: ABC transporter ATP-binding protein [Planctomycetes bacterium]|nr:ABC transporter ATP-binding protein [Planctomycetota bacterium]